MHKLGAKFLSTSLTLQLHGYMNLKEMPKKFARLQYGNEDNKKLTCTSLIVIVNNYTSKGKNKKRIHSGMSRETHISFAVSGTSLEMAKNTYNRHKKWSVQIKCDARI